ncbi:hypothetical protein A3D03_03955 [Candidatus Gottesmanbacteria bacterium RIFCSPHIGHO2_02_FULL_40_13]|uniref:Uncharacterized protein n=1 Tax=Candidatus Gottesmanbacteria bacterium RIFCSPHIGHO2_02_FULL_40_13 TaxID=1798384 RepID=A0A1F6A925_9BACT|nr:MAG: hypothetical protein A3D03_03955 [Candidatus Gottesmanbacteria bacterium RIFCSPHIGHO2_02_FULL_40_13]
MKQCINDAIIKRSGQTIIEVVIALSLIILFLSGVVIVELISIKNVQYSQNKSIAVSLARQQIERARVIRDTAGIDALDTCINNNCFINNNLTPLPVSPTGVYGQNLILTAVTDFDCSVPPEVTITPMPTSYKAVSTVNWGFGAANVTPAPELSVSSCITDWR